LITPDVILKSKRRTLSLCVMKDGTVVVRAPVKAKDLDIEKFIVQKQNWLAEKLSIIISNRTNYNDIINYKRFLYLGQRCGLKYDSSIKKIILGDDNQILIPIKLDQQKLLKSIKSWYLSEAKKVLKNRSGEISDKLKLYPTEIKISNSKGRWGACNSKNIISYNWRLIMLPPDIIDYVIVHELCHMIEFNHSKKFWDLVTAFMQNAKVRRNKIKEYTFLLDLFK